MYRKRSTGAQDLVLRRRNPSFEMLDDDANNGTARAGALRTQTAEKLFVEESCEKPWCRAELPAHKPLHALQDHTPPNRWNSLGG